MSDRLFFPLALLLAGMIVFLALDPLRHRPPSGPVSGGGRNAEDITVEGEELSRFLAGRLGSIEVHGEPGQPVILHLQRLAEQVFEDPRSGPHLELAQDVEFALSGRPIEVVIVARSTGEFPADTFEANYFAKAEGESGWQSFPLTREWAESKLNFTTPVRGNAESYDYFGIRPVAPDKRRTMEIKSVRFRATGPRGAVDQPGFTP